MIYSRRGTRLMAESSLLGLVVGLLVVGPWIGNGYLLLLDWVSGPNQTLTPGVYGLSGSALDAMPFRLATQAVRNMVGPAATAWLIILVFFPLAAGGIAAATRGSRWRVYPAVILFICNPFVVDRVRAGHVSVLLALALLPWIFTSAVHARKQGKWFAVRPALWYSLAMAISPHAAWLGGVTLIMVMLLPRPGWRDLVRTLQTVLTAGLVYGYALVLWLTGSKTLDVTDRDLQAYATHQGPGGLMATVLSLQGFWRESGADWEPAVSGWVVLPVTALVVSLVVVGLAVRVKEDPLRGAPLLALTAVGLLLAAGIAGPVGGLYSFAFDHLPLFEAMREQQKWLTLAVLGYAVGFGAAVEAIATRLTHPEDQRQPRARWSRPVAVACAALPVLVAPSLLWGLGGSVSTSRYPDSWARADAVMGPGTGGVLFLPWHAYQPFDFTSQRTIATPASAFFSRPALVSDAVELPVLRSDSTSRRTAYVDRIVALAGDNALGRLVAPLGVEWIAVAKNVDSPMYSWVSSQPGLQRVEVGPELELYRVVPQGVGRVVRARNLTFEQLLAQAAVGAVGSEAIIDPATATVSVPGRSDRSGGLSQPDPTTWRVEQGEAGWVVIPAEWSPGWQVAGRSGIPTVAGTIAFDLPAGGADVVFAPWRILRPALSISVGALLLLIAAGILEHRTEARRLLGSGSAGTPLEKLPSAGPTPPDQPNASA